MGTTVVNVICAIVSSVVLYQVARADTVQDMWQAKIDDKADRTYVDEKATVIMKSVDINRKSIKENTKNDNERSGEMYKMVLDLWKAKFENDKK